MSDIDRTESSQRSRSELDQQWSRMSSEQRRARQQEAQERLEQDAAEWSRGESFDEQMGEEMSVKGPRRGDQGRPHRLQLTCPRPN